jgi:hypothetical protein
MNPVTKTTRISTKAVTTAFTGQDNANIAAITTVPMSVRSIQIGVALIRPAVDETATIANHAAPKALRRLYPEFISPVSHGESTLERPDTIRETRRSVAMTP